MSKRAIRRHHYARLKCKIVINNYYGVSSEEYRTLRLSRIGMYANTPKQPSCYCCSSPRYDKFENNWNRLTIQERRALEGFNQDCRLLGI